MTDVDLWNDSRFPGVTCGQSVSELFGLCLLHKVDGAAAKSAAGQPRANQTWLFVRQHYHRVRLSAACLEILAVAHMGLGHQSPQLFQIAVDRQQEIDDLIQKHAQHWRMERMAAVDRNVLRTGVAEFLGPYHTPRPVVINEALEIARKFSAPESVQFINGVLDSVGKELAVSAIPKRS